MVKLERELSSGKTDKKMSPDDISLLRIGMYRDVTRAYFGNTVYIRRYASGSGRSTYKYNFRGVGARNEIFPVGKKEIRACTRVSLSGRRERESEARRILTRALASAAKIGDGLLFVLTRSRCLRASNPETLQQAR